MGTYDTTIDTLSLNKLAKEVINDLEDAAADLSEGEIILKSKTKNLVAKGSEFKTGDTVEESKTVTESITE